MSCEPVKRDIPYLCLLTAGVLTAGVLTADVLTAGVLTAFSCQPQNLSAAGSCLGCFQCPQGLAVARIVGGTWKTTLK